MKKGADRISLPKLEGFRCFGCGSANPIGLNMSFYLEKDAVCSDIVLNENYAGWETVVHGGLLTTLLDEVMAWTALVLKRSFFVTRKIEVKFLRAVRVNTPITVKGRLEATPDITRCRVAGTIFDAEGIPLTQGWADMAILPEKRLSLIPPHHREQMLGLFRKIEGLVEPCLSDSGRSGE